jgi:hypothetical protein
MIGYMAQDENDLFNLHSVNNQNNINLEVGKTYFIDKNLKDKQLSSLGFSFFKDIIYILTYKDYNNKDFVIFEVDAIGKCVEDNGESFYTDKIKVIKSKRYIKAI